MRDNFKNEVNIKGYVFNHSLVKKVSGPNSKTPGISYISGDLNVATDVDATNIVPVHFTYLTETYANGNPNSTYSLLAQLIDENNTYERNGVSAMKVRVSGDIETNDFVTREGELASPKRVRGSFVHPETGDISKIGCAEFEVDMLIEKYAEIEVEDGDNYGRLTGFVFNYANKFIPVDFVIRTKEGMKYFDNADISINDPLLIPVSGNIVSTTVENRQEVETVFGPPTVKVTTRNLRSWDIVSAKSPYEFGEDGAMSAEDVTKGKAVRAAYLDDVRKRHNEYQNSKNNLVVTPSVTSASPTATTDYKF